MKMSVFLVETSLSEMPCGSLPQAIFSVFPDHEVGLR